MAVEPLPGDGRPQRLPMAGDRLRDEQLVAAVLRRDRKATAEFVSAYGDSVYAYVRHRLAPRGDLVEDLVQEVFLAALAGLRDFAGASSLRSWLLGIARHKVEDYYRRVLREPEPLDDISGPAGLPDTLPPIDEILDRERLIARTQRLFALLPDAYRIVLLWRYWENRTVREMAEATGKTDKAMERLLARARDRFRQLWNQVQ